jgi:predicted DNA-binding antitoxin AbrB/MazE fold protein
MSQSIRAVYKGGQLWLLDPVHLTEGQEIRVVITTWKVSSDKANKRWRLRWQQQLQNVLTFAAPGQQ